MFRLVAKSGQLEVALMLSKIGSASQFVVCPGSLEIVLEFRNFDHGRLLENSLGLLSVLLCDSESLLLSNLDV